MENGLGVWLLWVQWWVQNMRDKHYKIKHIRMDEKTWEKLKEKRKGSKLSWNLFMVKLLDNKKQI